VAAGWLDEIVLPEAVLDRAAEAAREFATLNQQAHAATKLRTRAEALTGIRGGIDSMAAEFGL
jgi:enoyl-CoA hydratase